MKPVKKKVVKKAVVKPRKLTKEKPSIATYRTPGKGVSGEHLN
jgi:hypothetical protein